MGYDLFRVLVLICFAIVAGAWAAFFIP